LNYVILSLYYKYIALDKNKTELFSFAIENALKAVDLLPQNPGVLNNYSELLVVAVEEGYLVEEDKINDAIKMLQRIINRNPKYAKWHYVQGMLFSYIDKYNEARIAVREAIDLEDATTKDSLIRIAKYNTALLDFRSKESINTIEHSINRAEADLTQMGIQQNEKHEKLLVELDDVKSQYLEFLAFFSSIIAFITASINIVSSYQNFFIASSLIIVFSGCQSLAFCIFRLLINYKGSGFPKINIILSLVFSFLMIALGFFIGWYMGG